MKSLLIAGLLTALSINIATADTVRMGTEGAYPPIILSMIKKRLMDLSVILVTNFASGQI